MKLKTGIWKYNLPQQVCEIRNAVLRKKEHYEAIQLVKISDILHFREQEKQGKALEHLHGRVFIALHLDEIGGQLWMFPTPKKAGTIDLQCMQVVNL